MHFRLYNVAIYILLLVTLTSRMFHCKFCSVRSVDLKSHLHHRALHSNLSVRFWCGFNQCSKSFSHKLSLRSHVRRTHRLRPESTVEPRSGTVEGNQNAKFVCTVELCKKEFHKRFELIKHLKEHIRNGKNITCPYESCEKSYGQLSSFTSHLTVKHKSGAVNFQSIVDQPSDKRDESTSAQRVVSSDDDDEEIGQIQDPQSQEIRAHPGEAINFENQQSLETPIDAFLLNLAQFYLKLECELLIPSSTIQHIVSETFSSHQQCQSTVKNSLQQRLLAEGLTQDNINNILGQTVDNDPFVQCSDYLSTAYKRKSFFKKEFSYIEPIEVCLDNNGRKKKSFHYVPLVETLKNLFSDKSLQSDLNTDPEIHDSEVLADFTDGSVFQGSNFFKENPDALKLILYQDSFEVVNPLGAAVHKYKILAVYLSIGNLTVSARSRINSIKLVALCKEKDFDHKKVYGRIVDDLKIIETEGFRLSTGKLVKGALVFIAGDNLGSHQLGGFIENFSTSTYFCRYCLITRDKLQDEGRVHQNFEFRTVESYNAALEKIGNRNDYQGIKFDSVFNSLNNFHVCMPGLPPCLGHDLLEGVVAYDMKLYLDRLVENGWFSYESLNNRIDQFPYSSADQRDKPCCVSAKKKRIVGGAWQIWMFLRLLTLLIEDKIIDAQCEAWRCILLVTEIVEIVCAPAIHRSVLPYLGWVIDEYLGLRLKFDGKLRPKHHYMKHYPQLIIFFGPLMKVWTMRFESKHTYFKRALRFSRNYINVTKSMAEKHELFQSYLRCGADMKPILEMKGNLNFNRNLYNDAIQAVTTRTDLSDKFQECNEISIKGIHYAKGDAVFMRHDGYQYNVEVGQILLLLCDEEDVFIVVEVLETVFRPHLRAYQLGRCVRHECVPLSRLPSSEALHVYNIGNKLWVKPHYGLVRNRL